jgi:hypothetical protein
MRQITNQYNRAQKQQNTAAMERLRARAKGVNVKEQQQRGDFREGVQATRLEQRQMGLQQQFIGQIGELSATQTQQFKQLQSHLIGQMENQQRQLQQQSEFFVQLQQEQQRLADMEAQRAAQAQARANRDEGILAHQASTAGLFNLRLESRAGGRQAAANRRPTPGRRAAIFNV